MATQILFYILFYSFITKNGMAQTAAPAPVQQPGLQPPAQTDIQKLTAGLQKRTDPRFEYVAGGFSQWLSGYAKALPSYVDDLSGEYGIGIYERMQRDSVVKQSIQSIKLMVLGQGYEITPAVDKTDKDYKEAEEIADFIRRCVDRLAVDTGSNSGNMQTFKQVLYQMLDAMAYGHKIAEVVLKEDKDGDSVDDGKWVWQSIKPKPNDVVTFVVDAYYNVLGMMGVRPGFGNTLLSYGIIGIPIVSKTQPGNENASNQNNAAAIPGDILPRDKFFVFSFAPENSDPRGNSILRSAYDSWWWKQQAKKEHLKYLAQFGTPSLKGKVAPNAIDTVITDAFGNVVEDSNGNPQYTTPVQAMQTALEGFRNGSIIVLPPEADVEVLQAGDSNALFQDALAYHDTQIRQAITNQSLALAEGEHNARAASQTHQDVMQGVAGWIRDDLAAAVRSDLFYHLVKVNYGPVAAARFTPKFSLSQTDKPDFAATASAVSQLNSSHYFAPEQLPKIDEMLGIPVRSSTEIVNATSNQVMDTDNPNGNGDGNENPNQPDNGKNATGDGNGENANNGDNPKTDKNTDTEPDGKPKPKSKSKSKVVEDEGTDN